LILSTQTITLEVIVLSKKSGRGQVQHGINPQGFSQGVPTPDPNSALENAAKKSNKK
jgi:small acid-soluble spore protein L